MVLCKHHAQSSSPLRGEGHNLSHLDLNRRSDLKVEIGASILTVYHVLRKDGAIVSDGQVNIGHGTSGTRGELEGQKSFLVVSCLG